MVTSRQRKKIIHLLWEYPPDVVGGLGVAAYHLCHALSEHVDVEVVIPRSAGAVVDSERVKIRQLGSATTKMSLSCYDDVYGSGEIKESTRALLDGYAEEVAAMGFQDLNMVYVHDWMTAEAGAELKRRFEIPMVLHVHSTQVERLGAFSRGAVFEREQTAMLEADVVIAVSEISRKVMVNYYGVEPEKIHVVHLAGSLSNEQFVAAREESRQRKIVFVGRMVGQKSPIFAAEVICKIIQRHPEVEGVMVGSGELLSSVRSVVKWRGMQDQVAVLGKVPHDMMHLIYKGAEVLIMPSAAEPFGLVALEAVQAGLVPVISDCAGVGEVLPCADVISIQQFNQWVEAVSALLNDEATRKRRLEKLESQLARLRWKSTAEQILKITIPQSLPTDLQ